MTEINSETSDGYHTFSELYEYRRVYNAQLFNIWAHNGMFDVHKSKRHSDGEKCFGGDWFIVVAEMPEGQISNHYEMEFWEEFIIPEKEFANHYDGHTPKQALERLKNYQIDSDDAMTEPCPWTIKDCSAPVVMEEQIFYSHTIGECEGLYPDVYVDIARNLKDS